MSNHDRLARALLRTSRRFDFKSKDLAPDIVIDALVEVTVGRECSILLQGQRASIDVEPRVRKVLSAGVTGVWICDFRRELGAGTLTPFCPPRIRPFDASIPLRIAPDLSADAEKAGLRAGDALDELAVTVGSRRLLFTGQRTLAALSDQDARSMTWWLPGGDVLETELTEEGAGLVLTLKKVLPFRESAAASSGPNTLFTMTARSAMPCRAEATPAPREAGEVLLPRRSPLFDVWAQYAAFDRDRRKLQAEERARHPLVYAEAEQDGSGWRVTCPGTSEDAVRAWLGASPRADRKVRIDQPVRLLESVDERLTLTKARLRAPGLVEALLEPERGIRSIPPAGRLEAVENRGQRTQEDRQREAMERLRAGLTASSRLVEVLAEPASARPPSSVELATAPRHALDASQLRAVELILGCQDLVIVQGPPGTGKTRVIVEALRQMAAKRGRRHPVRVLVSSVQNEAIRNVAERLEATEGILLTYVRRRDRDDDEEFEALRHQRRNADAMANDLEAALRGKPVMEQLHVLRRGREALDRLRAHCALGSPRGPELAAESLAIASDASLPLTTPVRRAGDELAQRLRATQDAAPTAPLDLPSGPTEVDAWWAGAREPWPASTRAAVGMAAADVVEAVHGLAKAPERWSQRLDARWQALRALLPTATAAAVTSDAAGRIGAEVQRWVQSAEADLAVLEAHLAKEPDAIAAHFLEALRTDPRAWDAIVERHGWTTAATCSMSAKALKDDSESFDYVIVDEAGRASPFELLVPLVTGQRVVLIGDHRQLPPTVEDEVVDALERERPGLVSLRQETLFGQLFAAVPPECRVRLDVQYRMHGDIGDLVNRLFYEPHRETLRSHHSGPRAIEKAAGWDVLSNRPVSWLDVPSSRCIYRNDAEARAVLELLHQYQATWQGEERIGVICTYSEQRDAVLRLLKSEPAMERIASVATIDAVQGREYPVVLFCLVRSDGRPGFLAAPNRVNVALSRAQRQLVVIGKHGSYAGKAMFAAAPHLHQLATRCRERHAVIPWGGPT